jgi:uncharacterized protein (TIGR02466 family)
VELLQVPLPIVWMKLEAHAAIKDKLLDAIAKEDATRGEGNISRTDWFLNGDKSYYSILEPHLLPILDNLLFKDFYYNKFQVIACWFQQYDTNDEHAWHTHIPSTWSGVYYVELPEDAPRTTFIGPLEKDKLITPDVSEGDIIIFPSMLRHCSLPNKSKSRKTVISFNIE